MGILDSYFDPNLYSGLLGRSPWAQSPQQAAQAFDAPSSSYAMGNTNVPVYGQAPNAGMEFSAQSRPPQQAQVQAPPAPAVQAAPRDQMSDAVSGFIDNLHTGPIGSIIGAVSGYRSGNATANALRARGIDDSTIRAAQSNPGIMAAAIQQAYGTKDKTNDIKEYEYAISQGYKGSLLDFTTAMHQAKAMQNNVLIDQKGETEFSKEAGKLQATRFNELAQDAPAAKQMLSDVELLRDLGSKIGTGKGAEVKAAIGPYAQALGIDVKNLDEIQAYEAVVNRVAPNLRVKGSGAQSDYELRNFLKSIPSLGNTPGGNEIVAQTLQGLYQNKMAAAEIGSRALSKEITPAQAEKEIRALPDPMEAWRKANKPASAVPKIRTYNPQTGRIE